MNDSQADGSGQESRNSKGPAPVSYERLGVCRVINATATLTRLGGSIMPPVVVEAMRAAAQSFVDLEDLQRKVGERIAELTHNEAAYVSSGAAAGMVLATASCVAGADEQKRAALPHTESMKNQVVMQRIHRNGYDYAVRQVGVELVEIGDERGASEQELEAALSDRTACVFWFQGVMNKPTELPLEKMVAIADRAGVPVIVDAAAQLPPVENLWRFTELGASLAIFSGGKDLAGPQSTGLVLGRKDLIELCRVQGCPNQAIGRPMKVGKEELMGCLAAVERYLALDHAARGRTFERIVTGWVERLAGAADVTAMRDFPNEANQPVPWLRVEFKTATIRDRIVAALRAGEPSVVVAEGPGSSIHVNPMTLQEGEPQVVIGRLLEEIGAAGPR